MALPENEVIDSQFIAENIGFLDNCFDNSFVFQSLQVVKEHTAEQNYVLQSNSRKRRTANLSAQNTTLQLVDPTQYVSESDAPLNKNRKLKDWGLPPEITRKYEERGITEMFEWQVNCLGNPKVLFECCNLVYSAPTSAGKTLVAEILTIKTILERQKKVIIILPFVSIVREKMFYFQDILSSSGIRVEGFMGSQSPPGGLQAVHVAICTIEKANSLINKLLDEGSISELGAVIVDELHLLGDPSRGYILELLLTKVKYVSSKSDDVQIQIVGMSATLPNLEILASWLNAELFITDFRPIPLEEYCLIGSKYYDKEGRCIANLDTALTVEGDSVLKICLNTIKDGCSILIFCMTKNWCESLAQSVAQSFYKLGCESTKAGSVLRSQLKSEAISEVLEQMKNCPVGLDQVLKKTISFGVAYHHAGLTFDERDIVEGGFKSGAIRVLVATSTLSSGVNLPARKVIIRSPVFQRQPINILTYKQMIGRAGRMGKDLKGESIIICSEAEKKIGFDLMMGSLAPVKSCIESEDKYMRAVLEMIASQVLSTKEQLDLYSKCTLLYNQQEAQPTNFLLENTLDELKNYELVRIQTEGEEEHYVATPLGKACLSSSMAPNDGLSLFCELQRARQCLVLETDLHLIYLVTPYSVSSQWGNIDWLHLLTLWESLTKAMKRVGELIGIQESFIIRCLRGNNKANNIHAKINIHKRFYTALALQDLVNEVPLADVAAKFQCARGFLQSLQQGAATFAGMVTAFCRQLGWKNLELLISQFQDRLHFGIHSELLELMKLPSLNGIRARTLFDSGFETISSIASADINNIENILHKSVPFQSEKAREDDDNDDIRKRNKMKSVWITGYCGITIKEAAENLIKEARKHLSHEIGVVDIQWDSKLAEETEAKVKSKREKSCAETENCVSENIPDDSHKIISDNKSQSSICLGSTGQNILMDKMEKLETFKTGMMETKHETENLIFQKKTSQSTLFKPLKEKELKDNHLSNHKIDLKHLNNSNKTYEVKENEYDTKLLESLRNGFNVNNSEDVCSKLSTTKSQVPTQEQVNCNIAKKVNDKSTDNTSLTVKDSILWDSLNFTENGLENITKIRTPNKMSPNVSFGEFEKSIGAGNSETMNSSKLNVSTKDISLFSSEGDNSSLFEDSLPIDLISSNLLDKDSNILRKQETTSDYASIDSNTLLNAFKTTLIEVEDSEEDDIKLVYEDDVIVENELLKTPNIAELNEKIDKNNDSCKRSYNLSKEIEQLFKKKKTDDEFVLSNIKETSKVKSSSFNLKTTNPLSKRFIMEFNKYELHYYVLRGNDIIDNIHVIEDVQLASIYLLLYQRIGTSNEIIGSEVIDNAKYKKMIASNEISPVKGISIFFRKDKCIYLDFTSVGDMREIKQSLKCWFQKKVLLKVLCSKTVNMILKKWLGVNLPSHCLDISLFEWLIDSTEKVPDIEYLAKKYCEINFTNTPLKIDGQQKRFKDLNTVETQCLRTCCIWMIAEKQEKIILENFQPLQNIIDTESQVAKILANSEYYGITTDKDLASRLLIDVRNSQDILQKKAYKLCGYHFNFNSSKDVAKAIGIYNGRKVSTKKSVLTSHNSPLSSIVIYWRKLNSILTKTLYPLTEKACIYTEGNRINPSYTMFTCTGRISMHEPNLQNVPRTFSIPSEYLTLNTAKCDEEVEFNCRNIFKAAPGYIIVSADYCQLEMRILTHFSKDKVLMNIMNSDVDVFKSIAASWSSVPEGEVDDDLRQKAKQLCYGIIYGMGNRTLGQHLDVTEMEAAVFMDSFYKTYPAVKTYTQSIVEECRKKGYVETLTQRRRYLPDIRSTVTSKRSAAERQAVNTTIQGSAADIAKAAMCSIDTNTDSLVPKPRLILQMHDELIYEVPQYYKQTFVAIMKKVMEESVKLTVPLPVKVKCGHSWGSLTEVTLY